MAIKLEINMTNKWLYSLIFVGVLLALGGGVYAYTSSIPNSGHGGDSVLIAINGQEKTLQQAISEGDFESNEISCPCGECWSVKYKQGYKHQRACLCTPEGWKHTGSGYRERNWGSADKCDF